VRRNCGLDRGRSRHALKVDFNWGLHVEPIKRAGHASHIDLDQTKQAILMASGCLHLYGPNHKFVELSEIKTALLRDV
jgi:hypothetical protein